MVVRDDTKKNPFIRDPSAVTSCKTLIQYHNQDIDNDMVPWRTCPPHAAPPLRTSTALPAPPSFPTSGNPHLFSVSIVRSFQQQYINGVTQSVHSLDRLLSSSRIFWRFIKVMKSIDTNCSFPSFFIAEHYSLLPRDHILSSHSSLATHLVVSGLGLLQTKLL